MRFDPGIYTAIYVYSCGGAYLLEISNKRLLNLCQFVSATKLLMHV